MSKDQKETFEITMETVDNWKKAVDYIKSSLQFWFPKKTNDWPFNFLIDNLSFISDDMEKALMPF